jgi:DNA-binding response OmpR family regulator
MNEDTELGHDDAQEPQGTRIPRVLLVEDDTVAAAFMTDAILALPAEVANAATLTEALRLATAHAFEQRALDLYLIDAHLPDGLGSELLAKLRAQGRHEPALAHTAETAKSVLDALIDAGFEEVLIKPLSVSALHGAVRRFAGHRFADSLRPDRANTGAAATQAANEYPSDCEARTDGKLALWDDDAALRALNGHHAHVVLMRQLFRGELPKQAERIAAALDTGNHDAARAELHKLLASAGFVGAARLAEHARALQAKPDVAHTRFQFEGTAQDTLQSLTDQGALSSD